MSEDPRMRELADMRIQSAILECIQTLNKNKVFKWSFRYQDFGEQTSVKKVFNKAIDTAKYKLSFKGNNAIIEKL